MNEELKAIGEEMFVQDKRSTSYVYFVVVEDKKVYGVESGFADGRERKDTDNIDYERDVCEGCRAYEEEHEDGLPEDCDEYDCSESFINYRIEKDVPNLYAGIFFTAKACDNHIAHNQHHYNGTAKSYGMSAYHNSELQAVMNFLCPKGGLK